LQLADVIGSVRRHWRVSVAIMLLSCIGLGLFLFTRSEVRGHDRWTAFIRLLVPVRDTDGTLPPGVPPSLLQGQDAVALSGTTTGTALKAAGLGEGSRGDVEFAYTTNGPPNGQVPEGKKATDFGRGDIVTLAATTGNQALSQKLVQAWSDSYLAARRTVALFSTKGTQQIAEKSLATLDQQLTQVESQLRATAPQLLVPLTPTPPGATPPPLAIPNGTPLPTVLLAYTRQSLIDQIDGLRNTYAESATQALVPNAYASVVERPPPDQIVPELPSPLLPIAIALGAGLLLAIAVPVVMDRLDRTIRDARTAGGALSAPVLSTIPPVSPTTLAVPGTRREAAYRALAATSVATDQLPRAIVVTSPVGLVQDGVAANFAAALAGLGLNVALVATDARQDWFLEATEAGDAAEGAPTLPDLLTLARRGQLNGQIRDSLVSSHLTNLAVLPPGGTDSDALLEGLPSLLEALAASGVDVTVIAAPALLEDPTATILAWSTRSVLWVVEAGEVTEDEAREAAARLELAGASPFGVAMVEPQG